jgi:hypothetical protein
MVDMVSNFLVWYTQNQNVVFGVILVLLGPLFAELIGGFVKYGFKRIKLDSWLREHDLHDSVAGISPVAVLVTLVKLSVFLLFLKWGADIANVQGVSMDAANFVAFMGSVIWAVIILSTGLILGDYVGDRIKAAKGILFSGMMALAIEGFIVYLAVVEAFSTLGRTAIVVLLTTLFNGVVYGAALALGLAFGLAFGLGLKDSVAGAAKDRSSDFSQFLNRLKKK